MQLFQNVPNPFDRTTTITYKLYKYGKVNLTIYNESGVQIETLVEANQQDGEYTVSWDAADYPPGVYVYVLTQNDVELARKMMLIK